MPRNPGLLIDPVTLLTFCLDDYWAWTSDLISAGMIIMSGLLFSTPEYQYFIAVLNIWNIFNIQRTQVDKVTGIFPLGLLYNIVI